MKNEEKNKLIKLMQIQITVFKIVKLGIGLGRDVKLLLLFHAKKYS